MLPGPLKAVRVGTNMEGREEYRALEFRKGEIRLGGWKVHFRKWHKNIVVQEAVG